ncbi:MAG: family 1 glycosylhydrolase [Acholeplasmataceae bacterium]
MFNKKFLFGVATSSYQIEGTFDEFKTIWCDKKDHIDDQSDGKIACDFYHNYKDDIKWIKNLGVDVYRMSISWARIQPEKELFSDQGIAFYKDLFKLLKKNKIKVDVTLYHWDMPSWILDEFDGFADEKIIDYFYQYAIKMFDLFDKDVHSWATINEPWCVSTVGYYYGAHAPFKKDITKMVKAQYYTLLAHEKVYDYYKDNYNKDIGIVLNLWTQYQLTDKTVDAIAREYSDMFHNQVFLYPLFKGFYPIKWILKLKELGVDTTFIDEKHLSQLRNKTDYLGVNYYQHHTVTYDKDHPFNFKHVHTGFEKTDMDWEINAKGLEDLIIMIRNDYTDIPMIITENGAAFKDKLENGKIIDNNRINYIKSHSEIIEKLHEKHCIKGYYLWSLFDNFEWGFGYTKRFGIVYTDYQTLEKIPKESYLFYKQFIETNK